MKKIFLIFTLTLIASCTNYLTYNDEKEISSFINDAFSGEYKIGVNIEPYELEEGYYPYKEPNISMLYSAQVNTKMFFVIDENGNFLLCRRENECTLAVDKTTIDYMRDNTSFTQNAIDKANRLLEEMMSELSLEKDNEISISCKDILDYQIRNNMLKLKLLCSYTTTRIKKNQDVMEYVTSPLVQLVFGSYGKFTYFNLTFYLASKQ